MRSARAMVTFSGAACLACTSHFMELVAWNRKVGCKLWPDMGDDSVPEEIEEPCMQCHHSLSGIEQMLRPALSVGRAQIEATGQSMVNCQLSRAEQERKIMWDRSSEMGRLKLN